VQKIPQWKYLNFRRIPFKVIIDLMDNGGSMDEAMKLAGMFIDSVLSPLYWITKGANHYKRPLSRNDLQRSDSDIDKRNSASASEFFASALQDYNRALLMGTGTLGKATIQSITLEKNDDKNFVKISINKFYRVTGKSNQATGIIPNVTVPDIYETIYLRNVTIPLPLKLTVLLHV
jgi:carboxyl-terminal processing protease